MEDEDNVLPLLVATVALSASVIFLICTEVILDSSVSFSRILVILLLLASIFSLISVLAGRFHIVLSIIGLLLTALMLVVLFFSRNTKALYYMPNCFQTTINFEAKTPNFNGRSGVHVVFTRREENKTPDYRSDAKLTQVEIEDASRDAWEEIFSKYEGENRKRVDPESFVYMSYTVQKEFKSPDDLNALVKKMCSVYITKSVRNAFVEFRIKNPNDITGLKQAKEFIKLFERPG
jgi:Ca2+/Na+ antiporter